MQTAQLVLASLIFLAPPALAQSPEPGCNEGPGVQERAGCGAGQGSARAQQRSGGARCDGEQARETTRAREQQGERCGKGRQAAGARGQGCGDKGQGQRGQRGQQGQQAQRGQRASGAAGQGCGQKGQARRGSEAAGQGCGDKGQGRQGSKAAGQGCGQESQGRQASGAAGGACSLSLAPVPASTSSRPEVVAYVERLQDILADELYAQEFYSVAASDTRGHRYANLAAAEGRHAAAISSAIRTLGGQPIVAHGRRIGAVESQAAADGTCREIELKVIELYKGLIKDCPDPRLVPVLERLQEANYRHLSAVSGGKGGGGRGRRFAQR